MKVLFISRAFPPVVGGLENQNFALNRWLPTVAETEAIVNRHGKKALPWFLPWAAVTATIRAGNADVVLLGDGLLACVGWFIKLFHRHKPVIAVLYGLDITYANPFYQWLWPEFFFRRLDYFITISKATATQAAAHGVDAGRLVVIPSGIEADIPYLPSTPGTLEEILGVSLAGRRILLTVGRLVRRKGVAWFIEQVVPRLDPEVIYLIAGDGQERRAIEAKVVAMSLGDRVRVLGAVDEHTKQRLYAGSDLFIQPNIPVSGDMEGFGIVVLEAGLQGLPVVVAKLEGLQDAVHDGENGWLVPPADAAAFATAIKQALLRAEEREARRARLREYVRKNFSWESIIQRYSEVLHDCLQEGSNKVAGIKPASPKTNTSGTQGAGDPPGSSWSA